LKQKEWIKSTVCIFEWIKNDYSIFKLFSQNCLKAMGKTFHPECFVCAYCGKIFANSPFYLEDGLPYCEEDWNELFTTKCVSCGFPIEAGDRWVEALNNNYHSQCFNCTLCKKNLEGKGFFVKAGKPFCKSHARMGIWSNQKLPNQPNLYIEMWAFFQHLISSSVFLSKENKIEQDFSGIIKNKQEQTRQNKSVKKTKKMCDFFYSLIIIHIYCTIPKKRPITNKKNYLCVRKLQKSLSILIHADF